MPYHTT